MKIQFLGTAAAEGVPAIFCNCPTCQKVRALGGKELRTRTQLVIDGTLGIDFPPEAYIHSLQYGVDLSALKNLLVTHSHMDHFYAHDFILRGYKYALDLTSPKLNIYGNSEVLQVFGECTRRELRENVKATISLHQMPVYTPVQVGEFTVTAFPAVHTPKEQALLYLVEKSGKGYLHLYDTGKVLEEVFCYLKDHGKKVQAVAMDCTLVDTNNSTSGRHMGVKENIAVMARLRADGVANESTKFIITHFSHNSAPFTERLKPIEEQFGVCAAYDGMTVEI